MTAQELTWIKERAAGRATLRRSDGKNFPRVEDPLTGAIVMTDEQYRDSVADVAALIAEADGLDALRKRVDKLEKRLWDIHGNCNDQP